MAKKIELVVFDLAGTTVDDTVNGLPLVTLAMTEAFSVNGIKITPEQVNKVRGMDKKEALNHLLNESLKFDENSHVAMDSKNRSSLEDKLFGDFKSALNCHLMNINKEIEGSSDTFNWLIEQGVKIAVGSGFPHNVVLSLVSKLGWNELINYVSSAEQEGHGRPHPSLILSAMKHCAVCDAKSVIKVGDTLMDIEEGKNAGCWTVAVLTGTQTVSTLRQGNPDFIIPSVAKLSNIIKNL